MQLNQNILGTIYGVSNLSATAGTAIVGLIPPFPGRAAGGFVQRPGAPNAEKGAGITHITTILYTTGGTAHLVQVARPLNFTKLKKAIAAAGGATSGDFSSVADPGKYSTNYKYPIPGGIPGQIADNTIATNDYVVIQLDDGTWWVSTIAAGTFAGANMTLTTILPNNAIGASIGNAVYFYGNITTDKNPLTGLANPGTTFAASGTRASWSETTCGIVAAFNPGDPLLIYSPNATNAGTFDSVSGFYAKI